MESTLLKDWCKEHPGSTYDFQQDWQTERYMVGGKMFAMFGEDKEGTPILSLKCDPDRSEVLRFEYNEINPGYYMNKTHWISIARNGEISAELFKELIAHSYQLVFLGLTKKMQKGILEG
jgi:predicted DNA-binding protein (MmcQ/YjbR family)